ncbi:uncharacterized protein HKW66_Vig0201500 [Vigna angularis]|uniref:Uncharacterized protein n=1 Tax=Phaseolus angularis TaxID=3914 RepID=A0A8T0JRB0_PHAAN|nr:uncharacterized protein HKW66_Vig0201500 [Vigna angularis]
MLARREKGLCYNCDDKFSPGHKCKASFFLLSTVDDENDDIKVESPRLETVPSMLHLEFTDLGESEAQISFNALAGLPTPKALRIMGHISNQPTTILVDRGSTHNFIQDRVAHFLNLDVMATNTLKVMVGNGSEIECHNICSGLELEIQGHKFVEDLHVLPINGDGVVLGIQWLKYLGPIVIDYSQLTMKFVKDGKFLEFKADTPPKPSAFQPNKLNVSSKQMVQ